MQRRGPEAQHRSCSKKIIPGWLGLFPHWRTSTLSGDKNPRLPPHPPSHSPVTERLLEAYTHNAKTISMSQSKRLKIVKQIKESILYLFLLRYKYSLWGRRLPSRRARPLPGLGWAAWWSQEYSHSLTWGGEWSGDIISNHFERGEKKTQCAA